MTPENPQRYPIGLQDFPEIREKGCLYVDKTDLVHRMANGPSKYVFLSRPRRFGKSLLVSTLQAYFEGRKDLFKGLAIENMETEWTEYPVLLFSFARIKRVTVKNLEIYIKDLINDCETRFGIRTKGSINVRVKNLIKRVSENTGKKVAFLVDEYDSPLIEAMHDEENLPEIRNVMRDFYGPLKDMGPYLRFVFLTGITKFSHLGIFSELNNIKSISMMKEYAAICGITEHEMLTCMKPGIEWMAQKNGIQYDEAVDRLKATYDGYHFAWPSPDVYNPYSLMNALSDGEFNNYWFETGTPAYLVQMLQGFNVRPEDIGSMYADRDDFNVPLEMMVKATPLLYQSGYLTMKGHDEARDAYLLDIPNGEVRVGLMKSLLPAYLESANTGSANLFARDMGRLVRDGDMDGAIRSLQKYLTSVAYMSKGYTEENFRSLLYVIFNMSGFTVLQESPTSSGRTDLDVFTGKAIYVIELKYGKSAREAMEQINGKGYADSFAHHGLPIVKVGINFDPETKTVGDWEIDPSPAAG